MEDDKALRELLNEGALLKAPADFSGKVMAGLSGLQPSPLYSAKKWKQVFSILAAVSVAAAIVLSFFINPNSLPYQALEKLYAIPTNYLLTIAEYLVAFWLLMAISFKMNNGFPAAQKNRHPSYNH